MTWNRRRTIWAIAVLLPIPIGLFAGHQNLFSPAEVQVIKDKYRVFERALVEREPDEETLERVAIALSRRHGFFLRGKFEKSVDAIGEAWAILQSREWNSELRSSWSWNLLPPTRLLPVETLPGRLATLRRVAPRRQETHQFPFLMRTLGDLDSEKPTVHSTLLWVPEAGSELSFTVAPDLPEGSYWVEAKAIGVSSPGPMRVRFSVVESLQKRIASIEAAIAGAGSDQSEGLSSALASLEYALGFIQRETRGERTDYDGDLLDLLRDLETLAAEVKQGKDPYPETAGDSLREFAIEGGVRVPCRIYVPEMAAKGHSVPLLLALHGWWDDEHKFFEFNGAGALKRLAEKQGLIVVCPRRKSIRAQGGRLVRLVDHLKKVYPAIDAKRVFVLGHSWGVRQAMEAAQLRPKMFAGLALLAGSGRSESLAAIPGVPVFLTCGGRDRGSLRGCRQMAARAEKMGHGPFLYREVKSVGHVEIIWHQADEAVEWMLEQGSDR